MPSNPSNTAVLLRGRRLLALCEGGGPVELDPETLETRGAFDFGPGMPFGFGAHFKLDPADGVLYNIGLAQPPALALDVVALGRDRGMLRRGRVGFPGNELTFVHDFAMSQRHLVIFIPPWSLPWERAAPALLGLTSLGHSLRWDGSRGTRCLVVRKADLQVVHDIELPAFSTYHFCNAYEEGDTLHVLVCRLIGQRQDLEANFSNMYAAHWRPELYNHLYDYQLDLRSGRLLSAELALPAGLEGQLPMDFPVVAPSLLGRRARYAYTVAFSGQQGYMDSLQKLDLKRGTAETRSFEPGVFPSEVAFVPRPGAPAQQEDGGWLLYLTYEAATHTSSLHVLEADAFQRPPVAVLRLPHHVPYTFHGAWQPSAHAG